MFVRTTRPASSVTGPTRPVRSLLLARLLGALLAAAAVVATGLAPAAHASPAATATTECPTSYSRVTAAAYTSNHLISIWLCADFRTDGIRVKVAVRNHSALASGNRTSGLRAYGGGLYNEPWVMYIPSGATWHSPAIGFPDANFVVRGEVYQPGGPSAGIGAYTTWW